MRGWLRAKRAWAAANPLFWANLALSATTLAVVFVFPAPNASDFRLRTLGMFLQLIGVLTVWLDLTSTAREFGRHGLLKRTWGWIKAGVFGRQTIVALSGQLVIGATGRLRAKVRATTKPGADVAERLTTLEKLVEQVDQSVDDAFREIDRRADELTEKSKEHTAELERKIADLRRSLENAATGNFAKLAFGAAWLAAGVVLSSWAPEITKLAGAVWAGL